MSFCHYWKMKFVVNHSSVRRTKRGVIGTMKNKRGGEGNERRMLVWVFNRLKGAGSFTTGRRVKELEKYAGKKNLRFLCEKK